MAVIVANSSVFQACSLFPWGFHIGGVRIQAGVRVGANQRKPQVWIGPGRGTYEARISSASRR